MDFLELVDSVTYKPGEVLRVIGRDDPEYMYDGRIRLVLDRTVPDAKRPGETINILHNLVLTEYDLDALDDDHAKYWIYNHLRTAEIHECEEFLKFGGVQYRDPHANGG